MRYLTIEIPSEWDGKTVGEILRGYAGMSRKGVSGAKYRSKGILLDDVEVFTNVRARAGQTIQIVIEDRPSALVSHSIEPMSAPVQFQLDIVYEDDDLLVVNKPAGLVMYPNKGHARATLGNYVLDYLQRAGRTCVLHPVQRLDKGTSGLVVFTTNAHAQNRLTKALHTSEFERSYLALCAGVPNPSAGSVCAPIARMGYSPSVFAIDASGKPALTHYQVLDSAQVEAEHTRSVSLVRLVLETGRTHQIRLHMAHIGCPLLGDVDYGGPAIDGLARPALHSYEIKLNHPITGKHLELRAPLPADLSQKVCACGLRF